MAFSKKQYENFIRTIVVAAVAKEFRRAEIVKGIIDRAKNDGKIATGGLTKPELTSSIIPTREDRWLLDKESVSVRVGKVEQGLPTNVGVEVNVKFGVEGEYVFTRNDIDAKYPSSYPNVDAIRLWIKAKSNRGLMTFTYNDEPADLNNPKVVNRIAYLIGRRIKKQGINKKYKSDYFKPVKNQVSNVLDKALFNASERIVEKYQQEFYSSVLNIIDENIL